MINSRERAYLRGLANLLEPIFQVGKDGVTATVINTAEETITAHELIKLSVLETSPNNVKEVAEIIAKKIKADVVQVIGRRAILYRKNPKNPKIFIPQK